jgi:NAD-dependent SIR2 family protein deacetylase
LNAAGTAARWYLSERQYGNAGDVYRQTVDQLSRDVGSRDLTAAKEAYVRLNASCNACHEQKPSGEPPAAPGAPAEADSPAADDEQSDEGNASGPTTARSPIHAL